MGRGNLLDVLTFSNGRNVVLEGFRGDIVDVQNYLTVSGEPFEDIREQ